MHRPRPEGRLVEKTFPNGATTRYTYNPDNTLARVVNRVGASDDSILSRHDFRYDGVGNRITHLECIGATATPYAYDPLNRLLQVSKSATGAVLESYTYDPLGNRLAKTSGSAATYYRYDAANQLTQTCADAGCTTPTGAFTYDLSGNLVTRTDGPTTTMAYDAENRLAWINVAGQVEQSYAYDDQGCRIRKTVGGTTTQYLYDGANILAEYSTWAAPTAHTTHGPGIDAPLIRATSSGAQYYHADGLGSVVALSNANSGTDATARFDAWGVRIGGTGTIPVYGYTGREPDETGLIYYRARYYDPALGRFTQRDPIGLNGGVNLYAYVNANPVNFTDPMGLMMVSQVQASQATAAASPTDPATSITAACQCLSNVYAAATGTGGTVTDAGRLRVVLSLQRGTLVGVDR
ncbi:MAG TPA: RHS repeat-associated core domain-containing protein [Candidatus Methylomirabilis sp.]